MNSYIAIILGIFVIILIYILYLAFFKSSVSSYLISTPHNFVKNGTNRIIKGSEINGFTSRNFAISSWIYVKDWNTTEPKTIYSILDADKKQMSYKSGSFSNKGASDINDGDCCGNQLQFWSSNIKCPDNKIPYLSLVLDTKTPNLYLNIRDTTDKIFMILITNNFPLQKWTNVIISLEGNTLDAYIDGKLIYSNQLSYINVSGTKINYYYKGNNGSGHIMFGGDENSTPDISVTRCSFIPYSIDPKTASSIYMTGSGDNGTSNSVELSILKNNNVVKDIRLY